MASTQKSSPAPLPPLYGREKHTVGWQGMSLVTPKDWNPAKYGGNHEKGDLRLDDDDGVRLEIRWETTKKTPNIEKSVADFLAKLEKDARKRKTDWLILEDVKVVSRSKKKKDQLSSFGWKSEGNPDAASGYGVAWTCPVCERVVFAQILGRKNEKLPKVERLAAEVLGSLDCHGEGGWENWSVFDLSVQVPSEFQSDKIRLLLNLLDLEWVRPRPVGMFGWGKRPERISLRRYPIANILLDGTSLEDWSQVNVRQTNKQLSLGAPDDVEIHGHTGLLMRGPARDLRSRFAVKALDILMRRRTPQGEVRVWQCPESNRIWVLETEVSQVNLHVVPDVLDSLVCH